MINNTQQNIKRRLLINIIILVFTYLIPIYIFRQHQSDYKNINLIQNTTFITLFFGSVILIYINYKNRIQTQKYKLGWIIFQFIGIVGFCYSSIILSILFLFRNCCGI